MEKTKRSTSAIALPTTSTLSPSSAVSTAALSMDQIASSSSGHRRVSLSRFFFPQHHRRSTDDISDKKSSRNSSIPSESCKQDDSGETCHRKIQWKMFKHSTLFANSWPFGGSNCGTGKNRHYHVHQKQQLRVPQLTIRQPSIDDSYTLADHRVFAQSINCARIVSVVSSPIVDAPSPPPSSAPAVLSGIGYTKPKMIPRRYPDNASSESRTESGHSK